MDFHKSLDLSTSLASAGEPAQVLQPALSAAYHEFCEEKSRFDVHKWHLHFQSCQRYFLNYAQHTDTVKALASSINIKLPHQKHLLFDASSTTASQNSYSRANGPTHAREVSLTPYLRRLIATGNDNPETLRTFFGDTWFHGIGPLHEIERRNYLFASNSTNLTATKQAYGISDEETVPFLSTLKGITEKELEFADSSWNEWTSMQNWTLGPRASASSGSSAERR